MALGLFRWFSEHATHVQLKIDCRKLISILLSLPKKGLDIRTMPAPDDAFFILGLVYLQNFKRIFFLTNSLWIVSRSELCQENTCISVGTCLELLNSGTCHSLIHPQLLNC